MKSLKQLAFEALKPYGHPNIDPETKEFIFAFFPKLGHAIPNCLTVDDDYIRKFFPDYNSNIICYNRLKKLCRDINESKFEGVRDYLCEQISNFAEINRPSWYYDIWDIMISINRYNIACTAKSIYIACRFHSLSDVLYEITNYSINLDIEYTRNSSYADKYDYVGLKFRNYDDDFQTFVRRKGRFYDTHEWINPYITNTSMHKFHIDFDCLK